MLHIPSPSCFLSILALALPRALLAAPTTWTWISGLSDTTNSPGSHGTKNVANASNVPSARYYSAETRLDDSLYLFGGQGFDTPSSFGYLNDMWAFSVLTEKWTWVDGSSLRNQANTTGAP